MMNFSEAPTISPNEPPPGWLSFDKSRFEWNGPIAWNVRHGDVGRSTWVAGKIIEMEGVTLPGVDAKVELRPGDPEATTWRHIGDDGKTWVHGDVAISDDGILFIAGKRPEYKWRAGTLAGELHRSPHIMEAVRDFSFAGDLYGALCSLGWHNEETGKQYWGSWRAGAETLVSMRGLNESYTDFFLMGNEGLLTEEVNEMLEDIGWTCLGRADVESRNRRAIRLLEVCESRPHAEAPEWYRHWSTGLRIGDQPNHRIHLCAATGRVTLTEWNDFWEWFLDAIEE
jgi:hypothetical protein